MNYVKDVVRDSEGETGRVQFCFRVNLQDIGLFRLRKMIS